LDDRLTDNVRKKPYYSIRTGKNPLPGGCDLDTVRSLFKNLFIHFEGEGFFQEDLGIDCTDGFIPGNLGHDLEGVLLLELRKRDLTPIRSRIGQYAEEDFFDIIEFLYDHCSKPVRRNWHSWNEADGTAIRLSAIRGGWNIENASTKCWRCTIRVTSYLRMEKS
jgi:hypothetical protein